MNVLPHASREGDCLRVFEGHSANEAWQAAAAQFRNPTEVRQQAGRGGATRELLAASFVITDPTQRWVISRVPPMSVPFALVEAIGILAGRQESSYLNFFNPRLPHYAGAGSVYPGAYGFRLRKHFGLDQLERVYAALERNADTRQAVLQIWDSAVDIPKPDGSPSNPDVPCNLCSMLKLRDGKLFWTQIMRSNDLFRGAPYNFVQFTVLQEVLAGWLGAGVGTYVHWSDSLHVYDRDVERVGRSDSLSLPRSNDSLLLPKSEADVMWSALNGCVTELAKDALGESELERIAGRTTNRAATNILAIVAADSARRRGFSDLAMELSARCMNPLLSLGWRRWQSRTTREVTK